MLEQDAVLVDVQNRRRVDAAQRQKPVDDAAPTRHDMHVVRTFLIDRELLHHKSGPSKRTRSRQHTHFVSPFSLFSSFRSHRGNFPRFQKFTFLSTASTVFEAHGNRHGPGGEEGYDLCGDFLARRLQQLTGGIR